VRAVIPIGDKLFALGDVNVPAGVGTDQRAAVWSSTDAVTWDSDHEAGPPSRQAGRTLQRGARRPGRTLRALVLEEPDRNDETLWHSPDGVSWTRITWISRKPPMFLTIATAGGMAVVTGQVPELQAGETLRLVLDRWADLDPGRAAGGTEHGLERPGAHRRRRRRVRNPFTDGGGLAFGTTDERG